MALITVHSKPHDLRILRKTVRFKVRSHYCHKQSTSSLKKKKKRKRRRRKKEKKLALQSYLFMSQAVYLAVCSAWQKSIWIFPPWPEGQVVLVTPGYLSSVANFFQLTSTQDLDSLTVSAIQPLMETSLPCPRPNSGVFFPIHY